MKKLAKEILTKPVKTKLLLTLTILSMMSNNEESDRPTKKLKLASVPRCTNKKPEQNRRKPPNWFLAIPFDNPEIRSNMKIVQDHIIQKEPKLSKACVPIEKAHLTLFVFHTDNIEKVIELLNPILQNLELPQTHVKVSDLGNFSNEVLFAKLDIDEHLKTLWKKIANSLVENEIIENNAKAKIKNFTPHLTLMKLSKMKSRIVKKINRDLYQEKFANFEFGVQPIREIQVCSMNLPAQENGYYYYKHTFPIRSPILSDNRLKNGLLILSGATALLAFAYIVKKIIKK